MVKLDSLRGLHHEVTNIRDSLFNTAESIAAFFPQLSTHMRTVEFGIQKLQLDAKGRSISLYMSLSPWISFVLEYVREYSPS